MNSRRKFYALGFALATSVAHASPVLIVGNPGDSMLSIPSRPAPALGGTLVNFDTLTAFASFSTYTASGITISSPDGLVVYPFSTQSGPNELYDNSSDGSANLRISLGSGTTGIGIGIADSDPVTLSIQALGVGGTLLGSPFLENLATTESAINTGNGYYVVQDTSADIFGLQIAQATGSSDYSGLAVDDVQAATPVAATPEPASVTLMGLGMFSVLALSSYRRLKQA